MNILGLEPKDRFNNEFKKMNNSDIESAITQKIIDIRLKSSVILDRLKSIAPEGNGKKHTETCFIFQ